MSQQVREPTENEKETLAMKRGDMPPPVPKQVANPRIQEDQASQEFHSNSDKMHRATLKTNSHKHGVIMADLSSRNLWEKQVHTLNFTTCQRPSAAFSSSIWVPSTGRVKSENHRTWTCLLPKVKSSMSPICHFSKNSGETTTRMCFWQRRLTAYRQTQNSCLRTMALVWCHSSSSNDLSFHARIWFHWYVRLLLESSEEDDTKTHMQRSLKWNLEEKKAKGVITDPRERTAGTLFHDLESVAFASEDSDLNITENNFVPTAKCNQERQLATRSGLQRLRCCVCHLHHEQAMKSPLRVRQFFKTVLRQVHHFKVDVIAGDANAAAYKYLRKQQYQALCNSSVAEMLREMQREVNTGRPFESRLHIDYYTNKHLSQLSSASDLDLLLHGCSLTVKNHLDPESWENSGATRVNECKANENRRGRGQLLLKRFWSLVEGDG